MPKSVDVDAKRQEILAECLFRFAEKGYAAISMRQIASSLGVTTGSLYHYFPSKRDILNAILTHYRDQHLTDVRPILMVISHPQKRLSALCHFIDERLDSMSALLMVAIDASRIGDSQVKGLIQGVLEAYVQAIAALLQVSVEKANIVIDITFGHLLRHAIGANPTSLRQLIEPMKLA